MIFKAITGTNLSRLCDFCSKILVHRHRVPTQTKAQLMAEHIVLQLLPPLSLLRMLSFWMDVCCDNVCLHALCDEYDAAS